VTNDARSKSLYAARADACNEEDIDMAGFETWTRTSVLTLECELSKERKAHAVGNRDKRLNPRGKETSSDLNARSFAITAQRVPL
jgi:hypothetical protein